MIFATYQQWRDSELAYMLRKNPLVPCPKCNGCGERECDCCGHESDCRECDGEGEIHFSDLDEYDRKKVMTEQRYEDALVEDANALARWLAREVSALLVSFGFTPWQSLVYHYKGAEVEKFSPGKFHAFKR